MEETQKKDVLIKNGNNIENDHNSKKKNKKKDKCKFKKKKMKNNSNINKKKNKITPLNNDTDLKNQNTNFNTNNYNNTINQDNNLMNLNINIPNSYNYQIENNNNIQNNFFEPNFLNNNNYINIFNNASYITNFDYINKKLKKIKELETQIIYLKEKGLRELNNTNNINHYLLKTLNTIGNPCFNQNVNFNQMNNFNNFNFTYKIKTYNSNVDKIHKINIKTKNINKKDINTEVKKKISENNIINIDDIISGIETRTVVRINPIPLNYSSFDLCKLFDKYLNKDNKKNNRIYKAIYTPLCKTIGKNLGYCFVMMVKPKYVIQFYNIFNRKSFNKKKCKKLCSVVWADLQGDDFLKVSEDPLRSPIIFKDTINDDEN